MRLRASEKGDKKTWTTRFYRCCLGYRRIKRNWKRWEPLRSAVVGHEALEDIDAAFALLESFRQGKNTASYRAVCAGLISRVEALEQLHRLSWQNFL